MNKNIEDLWLKKDKEALFKAAEIYIHQETVPAQIIKGLYDLLKKQDKKSKK